MFLYAGVPSDRKKYSGGSCGEKKMGKHCCNHKMEMNDSVSSIFTTKIGATRDTVLVYQCRREKVSGIFDVPRASLVYFF
jgi:hypothetical protein